MTKVKIVKKYSMIKKVVEYCKATGYCCFDFETNGVPVHSEFFMPTVIGISFQVGSAYVIPLGHYKSPFKHKVKKILKYLSKHLFENPDIIKIGWNFKFEHKILKKYLLECYGVCLDGMLAKYLLDEERPNDLKSMVTRFIPEFADYEKELGNKNDEDFDWSKIPLKTLCKYCGVDCDMEFRLMLFLEKRLIDLGFYRLYRNLIMPNSRVLVESEIKGILVDRNYLSKLVSRYATKIANTHNELINHKIVVRYQAAKHEDNISLAIEQTRKEVEELRKKGATNRVITNREERISRLIAGEFSSKKDLKLVEEVNFNSPVQMIDLLFNHPKGFRFKIIKNTKDKNKQDTGRPSTDEEVLLALKGKDKTGFIENLLNNRELTKLYSTYILGMKQKLTPNNRIHGSFLIHGTVTGRLSSRNPNLQNIPRSTTSSDIKKMFIAPKGYVLLEVDYSQAELRIVAELSGDRVMIDMFKRNHSIHVATAARSYTNMTYEEFYPITKKEDHPKYLWATKLKKRAKTYNFGVLYGQSPRKLAQTIAEATGEPPDEVKAEKELRLWFKTFSGVERWIKLQHRKAKKDGYVLNMFGRKRRLPDIYSNNFSKMLEAQRQSVNAPIQGAASDFTQFSSIIIREEKLKGNLPRDMDQVYTVHDSLGYYIKPEDIKEVVPKIVKICSNPSTLKWFGFKMKKVNMKVSPEVGINWGELSDYDPNKDYSELLK